MMDLGFVDVREPHTNKLLFRYDPTRALVEVQRRGVKTVVDLTQVSGGQRILEKKQKRLDKAERPCYDEHVPG